MIIKDNFLILSECDATIEMDFPIAQAIAHNDIIVVRLEITPPHISNENVFCFNREGHNLWQIEARKSVYEDSPYTAIAFEGEDLILSNWDGGIVFVNKKNGKIMRERQGK